MNSTSKFLAAVKLQLNINYPSLEDCYFDGYENALAEQNESQNPYVKGTKEYEYWLDGWWDAFYGEKPLFEQNDQKQECQIDKTAANEASYYTDFDNFWAKILEISGVIIVSAILGYQMIDLVA